MPRSAGHVRRDGAGSIINIHHEPLHIDHIDIEAAPSIKKEEAKTWKKDTKKSPVSCSRHPL